MQSNPPQYAANLVFPRCRCCERRPLTQSHTALAIAKQCQPPWSAARSKSRHLCKAPTRRRKFGHRHEGTATPFEPTICIRRFAAPLAEATHSHDDPALPQAEMGL